MSGEVRQEVGPFGLRVTEVATGRVVLEIHGELVDADGRVLEQAGGSSAGPPPAPPSGVNAELTAAADFIDQYGQLPRELATPAVRAVIDPLMGAPLERLVLALRRATAEDWARRIVASVPRPTPAEEDAAARDYAETALSETVAALERIRDGEPDPQRIAGDLLEAHGHAPVSDNVTRLPCPTCTGPARETVGMVCQTCGTDYGSPLAGRGRAAQDAAAARLWASTHNHPDLTEWHGSCPACGTTGAEAFRRGFRAALTGLADAVTDLCWKATPYGGGESVGAYLLPAGTVHRLIGAAQRAGIPAAFRAIGRPDG